MCSVDIFEPSFALYGLGGVGAAIGKAVCPCRCPDPFSFQELGGGGESTQETRAQMACD